MGRKYALRGPRQSILIASSMERRVRSSRADATRPWSRQQRQRPKGPIRLALSQSGLVTDFNHIPTHRSAFDQHYAHALLRDQEAALQLWSIRVIRVAVPREIAIDALTRFLTVDEFWLTTSSRVCSFALSYPKFDGVQSRTIRTRLVLSLLRQYILWNGNQETNDRYRGSTEDHAHHLI